MEAYKPSDKVWNMWRSAAIKVLWFHWDRKLNFIAPASGFVVNSNGMNHYNEVIISTMASQITSLSTVYSTAYSRRSSQKHQSFASLAFVWGIHRGPVNSPHGWPVTRKMSPFDDVIMGNLSSMHQYTPWFTVMLKIFKRHLFGAMSFPEPIMTLCYLGL